MNSWCHETLTILAKYLILDVWQGSECTYEVGSSN